MGAVVASLYQLQELSNRRKSLVRIPGISQLSGRFLLELFLSGKSGTSYKNNKS